MKLLRLCSLFSKVPDGGKRKDSKSSKQRDDTMKPTEDNLTKVISKDKTHAPSSYRHDQDLTKRFTRQHMSSTQGGDFEQQGPGDVIFQHIAGDYAPFSKSKEPRSIQKAAERGSVGQQALCSGNMGMVETTDTEREVRGRDGPGEALLVDRGNARDLQMEEKDFEERFGSSKAVNGSGNVDILSTTIGNTGKVDPQGREWPAFTFKRIGKGKGRDIVSKEEHRFDEKLSGLNIAEIPEKISLPWGEQSLKLHNLEDDRGEGGCIMQRSDERKGEDSYWGQIFQNGKTSKGEYSTRSDDGQQQDEAGEDAGAADSIESFEATRGSEGESRATPTEEEIWDQTYWLWPTELDLEGRDAAESELRYGYHIPEKLRKKVEVEQDKPETKPTLANEVWNNLRIRDEILRQLVWPGGRTLAGSLEVPLIDRLEATSSLLTLNFDAFEYITCFQWGKTWGEWRSDGDLLMSNARNAGASKMRLQFYGKTIARWKSKEADIGHYTSTLPLDQIAEVFRLDSTVTAVSFLLHLPINASGLAATLAVTVHSTGGGQNPKISLRTIGSVSRQGLLAFEALLASQRTWKSRVTDLDVAFSSDEGDCATFVDFRNLASEILDINQIEALTIWTEQLESGPIFDFTNQMDQLSNLTINCYWDWNASLLIALSHACPNLHRLSLRVDAEEKWQLGLVESVDCLESLHGLTALSIPWNAVIDIVESVFHPENNVPLVPKFPRLVSFVDLFFFNSSKLNESSLVIKLAAFAIPLFPLSTPVELHMHLFDGDDPEIRDNILRDFVEQRRRMVQWLKDLRGSEMTMDFYAKLEAQRDVELLDWNKWRSPETREIGWRHITPRRRCISDRKRMGSMILRPRRSCEI